MRYFQPKEYQYVSQYTPAMMELDYKKGQELLKQEDTFNKDLFDVKNKYKIEKGFHSKQEDVDKANQFVDNTVDSISKDVSSGKLSSREGINRISMLTSHINNDKSFQGLKIEDALTKAAKQEMLTGKLDNAVSILGKDKFNYISGQEPQAQEFNANELYSLAPSLHNYVTPGDMTKKAKEIGDIVKASILDEKERAAGNYVEYVPVNGKNVAFIKNIHDQNYRKEISPETLENAFINWSKVNYDKDPDSTTKYSRALGEDYITHGMNLYNSYPGSFSEVHRDEESTLNQVAGQEDDGNGNKKPLPFNLGTQSPTQAITNEDKTLKPLSDNLTGDNRIYKDKKTGDFKLMTPNEIEPSRVNYGDLDPSPQLSHYPKQSLDALKAFVNSPIYKNYNFYNKGKKVEKPTESDITPDSNIPKSTANNLIKLFNESQFLKTYNDLVSTGGSVIFSSSTQYMPEDKQEAIFNKKGELTFDDLRNTFTNDYEVYNTITNEKQKISDIENNIAASKADAKANVKIGIKDVSFDDGTGLILGDNYYKPIQVTVQGVRYLIPNSIKSDGSPKGNFNEQEQEIEKEKSKLYNLSRLPKEHQLKGITIFEGTPFESKATFKDKIWTIKNKTKTINLDKTGFNNLIPSLTQ